MSAYNVNGAALPVMVHVHSLTGTLTTEEIIIQRMREQCGQREFRGATLETPHPSTNATAPVMIHFLSVLFVA